MKTFKTFVTETYDKDSHNGTYHIGTRKNGEYGVVQQVGPKHRPMNWDHSLHHGTHKTVAAAKKWVKKHANGHPHDIEVEKKK